VKTVLELRSEYLSCASRWASRSNITIRNSTTKRVRGDGAAFVPGANAISYVPRVDWDGSWALPQRELLQPVGGHRM